MMKNPNLSLVLLALLVSAGCVAAEKSSNPLSPSVAGPIPGVSISAPTPLTPAQGSTIVVNQQPITLALNNASTSGVRPLSYAFEVASDAGFTNLVFTRQGIEPGAGNLTALRLPDPLVSGRSYYWRARAEDGANTGPYSYPVVFSIANFIDKPTAIAPSGDINTVAPTFVIGNAPRSGNPGFVSYLIEVADADNFVNKVAVWTVDEQPGSQTTLQAPGAVPANRLLFWRVRGADSSTTGAFSDPQAFRTPNIAPPPPAGGGGGAPCGPPYPNHGPAIVACVAAQFPGHLAANVSHHQREANMAFLRDRVIETGRCGGLDLAWNLKRGVGPHSIDAIAWRHPNGHVDVVDIGTAYDDTSAPLALQWAIVAGPAGYDGYPGGSCP